MTNFNDISMLFMSEFRTYFSFQTLNSVVSIVKRERLMVSAVGGLK
jgi:hypothetical protein